jgi:hypothetical protein
VSEAKPPPDDAPLMTARQVYNVVSDTVGGPNVRLRDNLLQAAAIFAGLILGAGIGALLATERIVGALAGGFLGLLAGLFGSGIFVMVYRAVKHSRGKHD